MRRHTVRGMKLTWVAILGTGKLALEGGLHPAQLKDSVTSKSSSTVLNRNVYERAMLIM